MVEQKERTRITQSGKNCTMYCTSKKFTSAHLFQIAQEKSLDYLLIIYMKRFRDG